MPAPVAGQPQLLRRAFAVSPGDYDVYVALKEKAPAGAAAGATASPKIGVLKHELTVPSLDGELLTSSVIVAAKMDILPTEITTERQVGEPVHVWPDESRAVARQQVEQEGRRIQHHVLDLRRRVGPTTKKPNIEMEYNFHQKTAEGEKFFNKIAPQVMNAESLPPEFDLAAGHQLPGQSGRAVEPASRRVTTVWR